MIPETARDPNFALHLFYERSSNRLRLIQAFQTAGDIQQC
ncbi:hypothetical protein ALO95_03154 [Pseudomonas syringae pv. antirrhini]|uniref:Uncharacterized protein n=2 Tax=Pseudomonas syringae group TaxID=136849 RepID=A0A0N8QPW7_9PSED|nr:Unknown protein sequence [Pseudomonas syringae pv. apii]KPW51542.1 Unknown protein sequence [Pseudomonas syringae pv. antirrhini]RMO90581.1 hypothetical protein ALQ32_00238 [Pseudomonas syringae pv. tagetis]RMP33801.1 hypothetical protein ALQ24_02394 [Pseudomonas syringae pv. antirrhini]RMP38811.1 hypothetical protein ALQ23_02913 [Pseudomonas syringae pv. antirrhini]